MDKNAFQCKKDRGTGDSSTSMFMINHFLDTLLLGNPIPDVASANLTNAASGSGSLGEEVEVCVGLYDRYPNFLLVDVRPPPTDMLHCWLKCPNSITSSAEARCSKLLRLPTVLLTQGPYQPLNPPPARADRSPRQLAMETETRVAG